LLVWCQQLPIWPPALLKSNLYFDNSFDTVTSEPALHKLQTFFPNLTSIFCRLGRLSKESAQVQGSFWIFIKTLFFNGKRLLASHLTPNLECHPLSFAHAYTDPLQNNYVTMPNFQNVFCNTADTELWKYIYLY
jgi:hypothetical protein